MPPPGKSAELKAQVLALYRCDLEELRAQGETIRALGRHIIGEVEEAVANSRPVQLGEELTTAMHSYRQIARLAGNIETLQKILGNFEPGKFPKVQLAERNRK